MEDNNSRNEENSNGSESLDSDINTVPSVSDVPDSSSSWDSLDVKSQDDIPSVESKKSILTDEWEDILGSGALMKKTIREGEPDTKPKRLMICTINYKCTLENGDLVEQIQNLKLYQGDLEVFTFDTEIHSYSSQLFNIVVYLLI